jgi:transcription elongation GreA/GreB family factor
MSRTRRLLGAATVMTIGNLGLFVFARGGRRVSAQSPLGHALLGRRVGGEVDVPAPGGHYRCTIESATRTFPASRTR